MPKQPKNKKFKFAWPKPRKSAKIRKSTSRRIRIAGLAVAATIAPLTGIISAANVNAAEIVIDGNTYWERDELVEIANEIKETKQKLCSENPYTSCEYYVGMAYQAALGSKYSAVEAASRGFVMTAMNKDTKTARFIFFEDGRSSETDVVRELYLAYWPENEPMYANSSYLVGDTYDPYMKMIFEKVTDGSETWFPIGEEVEFKLGEDFFKAGDQTLHYYIRSNATNMYSARTLKPCLDQLQPGEECRLVFDSMGNHKYLPLPVKTVEAPKDTPSSVPTTATETVAAVSAEPEIRYIYRTITAGNETAAKTENIASSTIATAASTASAPNDGSENEDEFKTPFSGNTTDAYANSDDHNFPWWIVALLVAGTAVFLAFFAGNSQKSRKN